MGIIVPTIQGTDRKEILNSPPDEFLIPAYKIYLYVPLPPKGV